MKPVLLRILLTGLVLIGCGKRQTAQTDQPAVQTEAASSAQNPVPAPGVDPPPEVRAKTVSRPTPVIQSRTENVIRQSIAGVVENSMTAQLQLFVAQKGRLPDNFAEFANTRLDTVPRPPEGMKWVIDAAAVQVKAVPK